MKHFNEMTDEEKIESALHPMIDFPYKEWGYYQSIGNQEKLDEITNKYTALESRKKRYLSMLAEAKTQEEKDAVVNSVQRFDALKG